MSIRPATSPCLHGALKVKRRLRNQMAVCPDCGYICFLCYTHSAPPELRVPGIPPNPGMTTKGEWRWRITTLQPGTVDGSNQMF